MKLYENIRYLRKALGLSQDELASLTGYTSRSSIAKIESGAVDLSQSKIEAFAKALHTTPQKLMDDNYTGYEDADIYRKSGIDFFRIPLYSPICCGDGGFNEDNIIEYVPVPSKGLSSPDNYFCQKAEGESMSDAGINTGDLLVFEKVSRVDTGVIGCFCVDENKAMCKKYTVVDNVIMLMPMNSGFNPVIVDPLNACFRCIGRLRKVIKDF